MSFIDEDQKAFAFVIDFVGVFNEELFVGDVHPFGFNLKGLAEDAQGAGVGVECSPDRGFDEVFGLMFDQGLFEDGFARSWFTEDQGKASLVTVYQEYFKDLFLVIE